MLLTLPPFLTEKLRPTIDITQKKVKESSHYLKKIPTFLTIPSFSIAHTWKGASEIIAKFVYSFSEPISFIGILPVPTGNFCPCISWKPTSEIIVRYKLWENVGELLYVPLYSGQQIGKNFNIEIWSTDSDEELITGIGGRIDLSLMLIPSSQCDNYEVDYSAYAHQCTDIMYDIFNWNPSIGEYYNIVTVGFCQEAQLVNIIPVVLTLPRCGHPEDILTDIRPKIKDYTNLFFEPCIQCLVSVATPWDGFFGKATSYCQWDRNSGLMSVNGKRLSEAFLTHGSGSIYIGPGWGLLIYCLEDVGMGLSRLIWSGVQNIANDTPVGVYTYNNFLGVPACADVLPPTLEIVAEIP